MEHIAPRECYAGSRQELPPPLPSALPLEQPVLPPRPHTLPRAPPSCASWGGGHDDVSEQQHQARCLGTHECATWEAVAQARPGEAWRPTEESPAVGRSQSAAEVAPVAWVVAVMVVLAVVCCAAQAGCVAAVRLQHEEKWLQHEEE